MQKNKLEIVMATEIGDLAKVKELVDRYGVDDYDGYPKGGYYLTKALFHKQPGVAQLLLDSGAQMHYQKANCSFTDLPLHLACSRSYKDIVRKCIEQGADVNKIDSQDKTALYYIYDTEVAQLLLENNALVNIKDKTDHTPMYCLLIKLGASKSAALNLLKLFALHGAKFDPSEEFALLEFLLNRSIDAEVFCEVLKQCVDVKAKSSSGETALHCAIRVGAVDKAKILFEHGADVNACDRNGSTCLHLAVAKYAELFVHYSADELFEFLRQILESKRIDDINLRDQRVGTALHYAIRGRCSDMIRLLLDHNADPNVEDCSGQLPIALAALDQPSSIIKDLLDYGADVFAQSSDGQMTLYKIWGCHLAAVVDHMQRNSLDIDRKDESGNTFLHHACKYNQIDDVTMLLAYGSNPNSINRRGETPLHVAIRNGHEEILKILLRRGADVMACSDVEMHCEESESYLLGVTPLYLAIWCAGSNIVRILLDQQVDLTVRFTNGTTPIHLAARRSFNYYHNYETAELLVDYFEKYKLDIDMVDANGDTPLLIAMRECLQDKTELFIAHGADMDQLYWIDRYEIDYFHGLIPTHLRTLDRTCYRAIVELAVKLSVANLPFGKELLASTDAEDVSGPDFKKSCRLELDKLKESALSSLYDILHANNPITPKKIRNNNDLFDILLVDFPIYGKLIRSKIKNDSLRAELLPSSKRLLRSCLQCSPKLEKLLIPDDIIMRILFHFSYRELKILNQNA